MGLGLVVLIPLLVVMLLLVVASSRWRRRRRMLELKLALALVPTRLPSLLLLPLQRRKVLVVGWTHRLTMGNLATLSVAVLSHLALILS